MAKINFKKMNEKELNEKYVELRKELMNINVQISSGTTPKSPGQVRVIKKSIAKILNELKNREVNKKVNG